MASVPASLATWPARLGPYEILAKLRAGGMGVLLLGRRAGPKDLTRPVAIKVLHGHLAEDDDYVRMFLEEARLAMRIQHPNVVYVEAIGEDEGVQYLAMEYVHGAALSELMKRLVRQKRLLAPHTAAWITAQAAAGLHAAHETRDDGGALLGLVHRDVSPQNVLLSFDGHVKLIDFGIAKATRASTATGSLKGKIAYMSPEQANGQAIDRRSDVYALGVVLWEMLTGRRRFRGSNDLATLQLVQHPTLIPPSRVTPQIEPALDAVVLRALAPDPDERYATANALRRALIEVCPAAMSLGADDLALLLGQSLDDVRRERGGALTPETRATLSLAGPPAPSAAPRAETLTIHAPAGATDDLTHLNEELSELSEVRTNLAPTRVAPRRARPPAKRGARWKWIAALALTAVVGLVGLGLAWSFKDTDTVAPPATRETTREAERTTPPASVVPPDVESRDPDPAIEPPEPEVVPEREPTALGLGRATLAVGQPYTLGDTALRATQILGDGSVLIDVDGQSRLARPGAPETVGAHTLEVLSVGEDPLDVRVARRRRRGRRPPPAVERPTDLPFVEQVEW